MERTDYLRRYAIWIGSGNGSYVHYLSNDLQALGWYASIPCPFKPKCLSNHFYSDFRGLPRSGLQGLYTPQCSCLFLCVRTSILVLALVADLPFRFWSVKSLLFTLLRGLIRTFDIKVTTPR
jgi:hypothetical protein